MRAPWLLTDTSGTDDYEDTAAPVSYIEVERASRPSSVAKDQPPAYENTSRPISSLQSSSDQDLYVNSTEQQLQDYQSGGYINSEYIQFVAMAGQQSGSSKAKGPIPQPRERETSGEYNRSAITASDPRFEEVAQMYHASS